MRAPATSVRKGLAPSGGTLSGADRSAPFWDKVLIPAVAIADRPVKAGHTGVKSVSDRPAKSGRPGTPMGGTALQKAGADRPGTSGGPAIRAGAVRPVEAGRPERPNGR